MEKRFRPKQALRAALQADLLRELPAASVAAPVAASRACAVVATRRRGSATVVSSAPASRLRMLHRPRAAGRR